MRFVKPAEVEGEGEVFVDLFGWRVAEEGESILGDVAAYGF